MTEPVAQAAPDPGSVSTEDELRVAILGLLGDSYDRAVERRTGLSKTTVNDLRNERRRLTLKTLTLIVETYDPLQREAWLLAWRRVRARPARSGPPSTAGDDDANEGEAGDGGYDPRADLDPRREDLGASSPADLDVPASAPAGAPAGAAAAAPGAGPGSAPSRAPAAPPAPDARRAADAGPSRDSSPEDPARAEGAGAAVLGGGGVRPARAARAARARTRHWRALSLTVSVALVASTAATMITFLVMRHDKVAAHNPPMDGTISTSLAGATAEARQPDTGRRPGAGPGAGPPPLGPAGPGGAGPVGGFGPPRVDMSPSAAAPPLPVQGCYTQPLQTPADVVAQPGAAVAGVQLAELRYTYYPAWYPSLAVGGRLSAPVPDGWRLVMAAWGDPTTTDSTLDHNPGNGRFYPSDELTTSAANCFTFPPYSMGYRGYPGITTRLYAMLVDATRVDDFLRAVGQLSGFTKDDLASWDVRVLGYAIVPSSPM